MKSESCWTESSLLKVSMRQLSSVVFVEVCRRCRLRVIIGKLSAVSAIHPRLPVVVRQFPAVRSVFVVETDRRVVFGHLLLWNARASTISAAHDADDNDDQDDDEENGKSDRQADDQQGVVVRHVTYARTLMPVVADHHL